MEQDAQRELERELGDQYQIVRVLGEGAFGAVFLARERLLHRMVAIKVLHSDRVGSDEERARLVREARTVANLSHPAIVPLLALGETARTVYMVMPYVGGETLAARIAREGPLDHREVRRILIEVADALAYAHGEGVLHRDLKPENVLLERAAAVSDRDVPPRVRLIDFGVAAFPMRDAGVNASRETWGTPQFMAPEQAFGEPELDPRSELYSLGVLGFLLLGGELPFPASSPTERLVQQQRGPALSLAVRAPGAPRDLVAAIERCLRYEPEQRWARARDLRDALMREALAREASDGGLSMGALPLVRRRLRGPRPSLSRSPRELIGAAWAGRGSLLGRAFSGLGGDAAFAVRTLRKTPGFTALVVATLAIGLGATTAVFSALEALVLRAIPVVDVERLVILQEKRERMNVSISFGASMFRYDRYLAYREATRDVFSDLAAQTFESYSVRLGGDTRSTIGLATSGNYFDVLGVKPALGRYYGASEDVAGRGQPVAVVGYDFWHRTLGGDPAAIGRTLWVNSRPLTVIGVAPRGFNGAFAGIVAYDVWVPVAAYQRPPPGAPADSTPSYEWMNLFGRLKPGVDLAQASAALKTIAPRVPTEDPRTVIADAFVEPVALLAPDIRGPVEGFMRMLFAVAGIVLIIAATNAAGMLLARASVRQREVATRLAVGASRGRVVRQFLVESTLLCAAACGAGIAIAWWLTRALNAWHLPSPIPLAVRFEINPRVLGVAAAAMLGTALFAGLAPALQGTGVDLSVAMKEGGLQGSPKRHRLRSVFVVAQVALSVVLLAMAALFGRSLRNTLAVNPGFEARGVVHAGVGLGVHGYDRGRARALLARLAERLRARPEIAAASFAGNAPLSGSTSTSGARRADDRELVRVETQWTIADVGFAELLRVPLIAGRTFTAADDSGAPPVTVINELLARRLWPGTRPQDVLGRSLNGEGAARTVVGVIGQGKYTMLQEEDRAFALIPLAQRFTLDPLLYVRARGSTDAALVAARQELAALDPNVALGRPTLLAEDVDKFVLPQRVGAFLVGVFGAIGLVLSMTGLYGVLAFGVAQRMREFGVRMALGAEGRDIVRLVLRGSVALVGVGLVLGAAGAAVASRLVARFLFGLGPADFVALVAVPLLLLVVAALSSAGPARRAAGADPMASLRAE